jgi:hypothetical protein
MDAPYELRGARFLCRTVKVLIGLNVVRGGRTLQIDED